MSVTAEILSVITPTRCYFQVRPFNFVEYLQCISLVSPLGWLPREQEEGVWLSNHQCEDQTLNIKLFSHMITPLSFHMNTVALLPVYKWPWQWATALNSLSILGHLMIPQQKSLSKLKKGEIQETTKALP